MVKTPAGEQLSPKRTYAVVLATKRGLPLATNLHTRPDAEAERERVARILGYDPEELAIVGSAPPALVEEAAEEEAW